MSSNGLSLSREFFAHVEPVFNRELPELAERMAVGLVGEGSECFGFDDEISRDHDWGPGFCIWLPKAELKEWGQRLESVFFRLPESFEGCATRLPPRRPGLGFGSGSEPLSEPGPGQDAGDRSGVGDAAFRVGPQAIEDFYARFTGLHRPPGNWREWRGIPEHFLAVCTNGEVFKDGLGEFSAFREALLAFYPEDVRLKKIAARCMGMAQSGQYNLPRVLRRGDAVTAMLCAARFAEQALSMVFLLNKRYMPFYKWAYRAVLDLPVLGRFTGTQLAALAALDFRVQENMSGQSMSEKAVEVVEELCTAVAAELRAQGLSDLNDDWLLAQGPVVQAGIATLELRSLPVMLE